MRTCCGLREWLPTVGALAAGLLTCGLPLNAAPPGQGGYKEQGSYPDLKRIPAAPPVKAYFARTVIAREGAGVTPLSLLLEGTGYQFSKVAATSCRANSDCDDCNPCTVDICTVVPPSVDGTCDVQPFINASQCAACGDQVFCNGPELCNADGQCKLATPGLPCSEIANTVCDELGGPAQLGECLPPCQTAGDCDDGLECTGEEFCQLQECVDGVFPEPGTACTSDADCDTATGGFCGGVCRTQNVPCALAIACKEKYCSAGENRGISCTTNAQCGLGGFCQIGADCVVNGRCCVDDGAGDFLECSRATRPECLADGGRWLFAGDDPGADGDQANCNNPAPPDFPNAGETFNCPNYASGIDSEVPLSSLVPVGKAGAAACNALQEVGDDYELAGLAPGEHLEVTTFRFIGGYQSDGIPGSPSRIRISFYDADGNFIEDTITNGLIGGGKPQLRTIIYAEKPRIPKNGFVSIKAAVRFSPFGKHTWMGGVAQADTGGNDPNIVWKNGAAANASDVMGGTPGNPDAPGIMAFEIVGNVVPDPSGACCDSASGNCDLVLPWLCERTRCSQDQNVLCNPDADCPGGECVASVCVGGSNDTNACDVNVDCGGGNTCLPSGFFQGSESQCQACQNNEFRSCSITGPNSPDCPACSGVSGSCSDDPGNNSCNVDADCVPFGGGVCVPLACDLDSDCPEGVCTGTSCVGGTNDGNPCDPDVDCAGGVCDAFAACNPVPPACTLEACCPDNPDGSCVQIGAGDSCPTGYTSRGNGTNCDPNLCVQTLGGYDTCADASAPGNIHLFDVKSLSGCETLVWTSSGNNLNASFGDFVGDGSGTCEFGMFAQDGGTQDRGWWHAFHINSCANVRMDFCGTGELSEDREPHTPGWANLWAECNPCGATISSNIVGGIPEGGCVGTVDASNDRGGPFCARDDLWETFGPLQAGTYWYPVFSGAVGTFHQYQLHFSVSACPRAACCLSEDLCVKVDDSLVFDVGGNGIACPGGAGDCSTLLHCDNDLDATCTADSDCPACVGGANEDGACECPGGVCEEDCPGGACEEDCPGGACEADCPGGACEADCPGGACEADCPGGACDLGVTDLCIGGTNDGVACDDVDDCTGGANDGIVCDGVDDCTGGANDGVVCDGVDDCTGGANDGIACDDVDDCTGGANDGIACDDVDDCTGGTDDGIACDLGLNCDGGTCTGTATCRAATCGACALVNAFDCTTVEGQWSGFGDTRVQCSGGECVGGVCVGGDDDGFSCFEAAGDPVTTCDLNPCEIGSCCAGPAICDDRSNPDVPCNPANAATCLTRAQCTSGTFKGGAGCADLISPCPACDIIGGTNCQYPLGLGLSYTSDLSLGTNGVTVADDFEPSGTVLNKVCVWGTYTDPSGPSPTGDSSEEFSCVGLTVGETFRVRVFADGADDGDPTTPAGLPGAMIGQSLVSGNNIVSGPERGTNLENTFGIVMQSFSLTLNTPITGLTVSQRHWLEVVDYTPEPEGNTCWWSWAMHIPDGREGHVAVGISPALEDANDIESRESIYVNGSSRGGLDMAFCLDMDFNSPDDPIGACWTCGTPPGCTPRTLSECTVQVSVWDRSDPTCLNASPPPQPNDFCSAGSSSAAKVASLLTCGDGILDVGEQCDDNNVLPNDGCDGNCQLECTPTIIGGGSGALKISDGLFSFDNACANVDGPTLVNVGGDEAMDGDIWYEYTSTCTGKMLVDMCPTQTAWTRNGFVGNDSELALYHVFSTVCDGGANDGADCLCPGNPPAAKCTDPVQCPGTAVCDENGDPPGCSNGAIGMCRNLCPCPGSFTGVSPFQQGAGSDEGCNGYPDAGSGFVERTVFPNECWLIRVGTWMPAGSAPGTGNRGRGLMSVGCEGQICFPSSPPLVEVGQNSAGFPTDYMKPRVISVSGGDAGRLQAIRVTWMQMPPGWESWVGQSLFAGEPFCGSQAGGTSFYLPVPCPPVPDNLLLLSELQCDPYYTDWSTLPVVHLIHEAIAPSKLLVPAGPVEIEALYDVQFIDQSCAPSLENSYSNPLEVRTAGWADVVAPGPSGSTAVSEDNVNVFDTLNMQAKFTGQPGSVSKASMELLGVTTGPEPRLDGKTTVNDLVAVLGGFQGQNYPFTEVHANPPPGPCPP